ncbi:MAG: MBL fold metallo-hydrolase [Bacteroidia bacterium]|nr:MBL fold metallo-hydrolase [Bacteroidia bacterium]
MSKQFGGKVTKADLARYAMSPNWKDGSFKNQEETSVGPKFYKIPGMIYKQIKGVKESKPAAPLSVIPFDRQTFTQPAARAKFIWYGHSVVLLQINGKTLLIDPMLGPDTSPIAPIPTRRFSENTLDLIDDFPEIDLLLLTHDHYDHLDYSSIQKLIPKTRQYFVALGVKRHLVSWGIDSDRITEFDWWDKHSFENIGITFTPTRHFSGRGLTDRFKSLWGGWAFQTENENIWFSGDGGYGKHFTEIGQRLGPFDFAFMECGQYNEYWRDIHLFPDESVQAALDAKVKKAMPVHWAGFPLSFAHTWTEPAIHFVQAASHHSLPFSTPPPGKLFAAQSEETNLWWSRVL